MTEEEFNDLRVGDRIAAVDLGTPAGTSAWTVVSRDNSPGKVPGGIYEWR